MLKMRWALVVALAISAPLYPESVDLPPLDAPVIGPSVTCNTSRTSSSFAWTT